jgi:hypothetical protein
MRSVYWMQNITKTELHHRKRGREDKNGKGEQDGKSEKTEYSQLPSVAPRE